MYYNSFSLQNALKPKEKNYDTTKLQELGKKTGSQESDTKAFQTKRRSRI